MFPDIFDRLRLEGEYWTKDVKSLEARVQRGIALSRQCLAAAFP